MSNSTIKVLVAPKDRNPYQQELMEALEPYGVDWMFYPLKMTIRFFWAAFRVNADILHLHWLSFVYHRPTKHATQCVALMFVAYLWLFKRTGRKIVITMHNLLPHASKWSGVDRWVRCKAAQYADALIFHDVEARLSFNHEFLLEQTNKQFVIPIGVYNACKVPLPSRAASKEYFGLAESPPVVLFFGRMSQQKGTRYLQRLTSHSQGSSFAFLIAGPQAGETFTSSAANVLVLDRFISEFEIPVLFAAADVCILPYEKCTTSAFAVQSIGFGCPIVCSNLPAFREYVSSGLAISCNPEDIDAMLDAITEAVAMKDSRGYSEARQLFVEKNSWAFVAEKTFQLYQCILKS